MLALFCSSSFLISSQWGCTGPTSTGTRVGALPPPAMPDGTEPREVADQLLLGQRAGDVDRPDVDPGPAALLQDGADAPPIREGELPRRVRAGEAGGSAAAAPRRARPSS